MQNAFTRLLAAGSAHAGLPAHQRRPAPRPPIVHEELLISLFHAQGSIWPELGRADRRGAAGLRVCRLLRFPRAAADSHRNARPRCSKPSSRRFCAFASQEQIGTLVEIQRASRADRVSPRVGVPLLRSRSNTMRFSRGRPDARQDLLPGRRSPARRRRYLAGIMIAPRPGLRLRAQRPSRRRRISLPTPYAALRGQRLSGRRASATRP